MMKKGTSEDRAEKGRAGQCQPKTECESKQAASAIVISLTSTREWDMYMSSRRVS